MVARIGSISCREFLDNALMIGGDSLLLSWSELRNQVALDSLQFSSKAFDLINAKLSSIPGYASLAQAGPCPRSAIHPQASISNRTSAADCRWRFRSGPPR